MQRKTKTADLPGAFAALKSILAKHSKGMRVVTDEPGHYALETAAPAVRGKPVYFAGVQVRKNYVSFYFMPVYCSPELKAGISPELRKRMQGKACFNFTSPDTASMKELGPLVRTGARFFKDAEWGKILANARCD
ncbi:MAG: hypothetical protein JO041_03810 [Acidobacteria bacterium]|nr:hypothetical protein [Acidobacteriota bacterium]